MVTATKTLIDTNRFVTSSDVTSFSNQYYHIYNIRLKRVKDALKERAKFRWGTDVRNVELEKLNAELGDEEVFVIGTLFKSMPKQPSILKEQEDNEPTPIDPNENFSSDEDCLILHETDENVKIEGLNPSEHVTGIPVAISGRQINGGAGFHANDICYSGPILDVYKSNDDDLNTNGKTSDKNDKMLIVSGLDIGIGNTFKGDERKNYISALRGLLDFVRQDSSIKKVVIAGNSIKKDEKLNRIEAFRYFDEFVYNIAQGDASIDVMPGRYDPCSMMLPQQPFHPKIFPKSHRMTNFVSRTNPCLIQYRDYTILGTSGENVDAIRQYSKIEYATTILKNTLEWGHIAPNAPDNLYCIPYKDDDPFLIDYVPDIYFAGNQPEFAVTTYSSERKEKIQLLSVPKFSLTLSCVQVDLTNLNVELKTFDQIKAGDE